MAITESGPGWVAATCPGCGGRRVYALDCRRDISAWTCTCPPPAPRPYLDEAWASEVGLSRDGPPSARNGPPCWELLNDAAEVLKDPNWWPKHLCRSMMEESVLRWSERIAPEAEEIPQESLCECRTCRTPPPADVLPPGWWRHCPECRALMLSRLPIAAPRHDPPRVPPRYPLPVGALSAGHAYGRGMEVWGGWPGRGLVPVRWTPFDGDERALLILTAQVGETRVELFGLAGNVGEWQDIDLEPTHRPVRRKEKRMTVAVERGGFDPALYERTEGMTGVLAEVGELRHRVTGDATSPAVKALLGAAGRWWKNVEMGEGGRGRLAGSGAFPTAASFADRVDPIVREHIRTTGKRPTTEWVGMQLEEAEVIRVRNQDGWGAKDPGRSVQRWAAAHFGSWDAYLSRFDAGGSEPMRPK